MDGHDACCTLSHRVPQLPLLTMVVSLSSVKYARRTNSTRLKDVLGLEEGLDCDVVEELATPPGCHSLPGKLGRDICAAGTGANENSEASREEEAVDGTIKGGDKAAPDAKAANTPCTFNRETERDEPSAFDITWPTVRWVADPSDATVDRKPFNVPACPLRIAVDRPLMRLDWEIPPGA